MQCPECELTMQMDSQGICACISCGYRHSQDPKKKYSSCGATYTNIGLMQGKEPEFTQEFTPSMAKTDSSKNNGGKTDYYQLPQPDSDGKYADDEFQIKDADDFAEWRNMNSFQGNMLKVMWTFNTGRHDGTDEIRDLNKIIHYAQRQIQMLERNKL